MYRHIFQARSKVRGLRDHLFFLHEGTAEASTTNICIRKVHYQGLTMVVSVIEVGAVVHISSDV